MLFNKRRPKKQKTEFQNKFAFAAMIIALFIVAITFFTKKILRGPAAVQKVEYFDFDKLTGDQWKVAIQREVIDGMQLIRENNEFVIQLNQFIVTNEGGRKELFCDYYDSYEIKFEAEGMAIHGERPSLVVSAPCVSSLDVNKTDKLIIPFAEFKKLKPGSIVIDSEIQKGVSFEFDNLPDAWPEHWVLAAVKLSNKNNIDREMEIDRRGVYQYSQIPPVMLWENE